MTGKLLLSSITSKAIRIFLERYLLQGFWKQVAVLAGGTALAQAIIILASPILSRLYEPDEFGILQVYVSVTALILVISSWRYEYAIPLPEDDQVAVQLLLLSTYTLIITCLILSLFSFSPSTFLLTSLNIELLQPYLWLIPLGVLGGGVYNILNYWAIRRSQYSSIARTQFTKSFGQVITQVILGLLMFGTAGLLLGDIIGKTSGIGTLFTKVWHDDKHLLTNITVHKLKKTAWHYRRFPLISSFSSLINGLGINLPTLLLMAFYGPHTVGWFALGQRIMNIPLMMIGKAVSQVYYGQVSQVTHNRNTQLRKFYLKTALRLFLISLIPIGLVSLIGPWLFVAVFGESWKQAGVYIQLLLPASIAKFVVNPLSQTLIVLDRQDLQLIWDVSRLITVVAAFSIPGIFQWSATYAIGLYSICSLLTNIVLFFLSLYALKPNTV